MRGKRLTERRQRIQAIEQAEAYARCTYCRAPLVGEIVESFLTGGRFCSSECMDAANEPKPRGFQRMGN